MGTPNTLSVHPSSTGVVRTVPHHSVHEDVYGHELSQNDRRLIVQPEWKSVVLLTDVVRKFSKADPLVLDAFA